jgi:hypothetical protein
MMKVSQSIHNKNNNNERVEAEVLAMRIEFLDALVKLFI